MARKFFLFSFAVMMGTAPVFAQRSWTNTTTGTFSWTDTTKWSPQSLPGSGDDARITNSIASGQTITNAGQGSGTINYLAISNATAGTTTVIQQTNTAWTSQFGISLGTNGFLRLTTNATFGITANGLN